MLQTIDNQEALFLKNTNKEELEKIAWAFREFIAIKLTQRNNELFSQEPQLEEIEEELEKTHVCIYALKEYMQHLKTYQLLKESGLPSALNVKFCKEGKWEKLIENFENKDAEMLEMMLLKDFFEKSLNFTEYPDVHDSRYIKLINKHSSYLQTLNILKDCFKSFAATDFFKLLDLYWDEWEGVKAYYGVYF